ncbi:cell division inhibitor SULA [Bdellovibrio bacteriovorus W]|nr:cell division inhibitor SULA [Bdellovibrio bacteriovorus W]
MKILITGATGTLGREIGKVLARKGHELFVISRDKDSAKKKLPFPCQVIEADLSKGSISKEELKGIEGVVNLIGASVMGRWNEKRKNEIYKSRVDATRNLVQSLPEDLKVFVAGSAMGFYGEGGDRILTEDLEAGHDFLAKVCVDWEAESAKAAGRHVFVRTGIVLSYSGALKMMLPAFRNGLGGVLGRGQNWMSWIHLEDIVSMFVFAIENENVNGPLNGCAPHPVTNKVFTKSLVHSLEVTQGPPVPLVALKVLFGEMGSVIVGSTRGSAEKAEKLGFEFKYSFLDDALKDLCEVFKGGGELYTQEQYLPLPRNEVFHFFQNPENLEKITPDFLGFHILASSDKELQEGSLIDYRLKLYGVPMKWRTLIQDWQPPFKFTDSQVVGPYKKWVHRHSFEELGSGTLMSDRVEYKLPMGFLGRIAGGYKVGKDIEKIFKYRRKAVRKMMFKDQGS